MMTRNAHVSDFIEYYCNLPVVPEYALLIKGAWGCGKSHLVNETIENLENSGESIKFLYVSLYGITSIDEIEEKFFQSLNPILSSKGMVFARKLAKGLLKGALKVDIDGDGKVDGTINPALPDINISDYLTDTNNCILVFDDLERCSMPIKNIMGYINHFVEKGGYKVIIIADEDKLTFEENNKPSYYSLIKEKLIGKTLEVEADVNYVFDVFTNEVVKNESVMNVLQNYKCEIISQFNASGYNNLRSLRKSLMDFERLYLKLDKDVIEKDEVILHLTTIFIVLSLEIHSGKIKPKQIHKLFGVASIAGRMLANRDSSEPDKFSKIIEKYKDNFYESLIDIGLWVEFFDKGFLDNKINDSIKNSRYFYNDNTPSWRRLWSLYDLNDKLFDKYYVDVKEKFDRYGYTNLGEVKHIGGLFLRLSDEGLLKESNPKETFKVLKNYIYYIFIENIAEVNDSTYEELNNHVGYGGLGWPNSSLPYFTKFSDCLNKKVIKSQIKALEKQSSDILKVMKTDFRTFNSLLSDNEYEKSRFQSKPIMQHVDMDDFMGVFLDFNGHDTSAVTKTLCRRYGNAYYHENLKDDFIWLESFLARLKYESNNRKGKVTSFFIKNSIPDVERVVNKMKTSLDKSKTPMD